MFYLYIIYSASKDKFYIGQTSNLQDRFLRHNQGRSKSTKFGVPWVLIHQENFESRQESVARERFLKSPEGWTELKYIKKHGGT